MFLAAGSVAEILKVVQIISWIVFPVLMAVIGATIYFHYRKKKKNRAEALSADEMLPLPATLAYRNEKADYILFDHTGLVQQYHEKLCHSQARYAALQQKFSALEVKCAAMAVFISDKSDVSSAISSYPVIKKEIDRFVKKYNTEKKEWEDTSEQLAYAFRNLEKENQLLRTQLQSISGDAEMQTSAVADLTRENTFLRDQLAEHEYLLDVLNEKKRQISHLERQLYVYQPVS